MPFPSELRQALESETAHFQRSALVRASAALSERYKSDQSTGPPLSDPLLRGAYLAARLPATFAAIERVLRELRERDPGLDIESMLDLGSGPGTALWAAAEVFPMLQRATAIEADSAWIEIGKRMAAPSSPSGVSGARWIRQDLRSDLDLPSHDMVVMAYALSEIPAASRQALLDRALRATIKFLVVIEPGTMKGFAVVHGVRSTLIAAGSGIVAPCPHREICPLAAAGDWCHFAQRVARSSLHRQVKGGELAYEDEKFSYIVADKRKASPSGGGRIVRHPQKHSGHVQLALCTAHGIARPTIGRSDKARYKLARHAQWGDLWQEKS